MIAYVDSSVLLRIILGQADTLREWNRISEGIASALVEVECLRTLDRLRLSRLRDDEALAERRETVFRLMDAMEVIDVGRSVLARAAHPLPTALGTLDAIHLATALLWKERAGKAPAMATHDTALAVAARASGLTVIGV